MNQTETREFQTASPTLEDVATAAGVSTATVSRCLNNPEKVVETTRARVLSVVRELGYAPNFSARALASKRTNTVGAIIPTMENAIFARGLQMFQEELGRHGFTLLVSSSAYKPDLEEEQIRTLLARGADALLLIGFRRSEMVYDLLRRRKVPFIVAWAYDREESPTSIGFDNRLAMKTLTERVLTLGHRQIAMISAPREHNDRADERCKGVLEAARNHGIDPADVLIVETPYSVENGAAAFQAIMTSQEKPTAVMAGNDVLAVGALRMARQMGIDVPGEVSITGFDDIELSQLVEPPLTTVHVPHRRMGTDAANMLIRMINGDEPPQSKCLETSIRMRETLGPVPK